MLPAATGSGTKERICDMDNFEKAKEKIEAGKKEVHGRYETAMMREVTDALLVFAEQDDEFARAIVQGGSIADCMKAVAKGVTNQSISDMKAFGLAVDFFFPGAKIDVRMTVRVNGEDPQDVREDTAAIIDLTQFF